MKYFQDRHQNLKTQKKHDEKEMFCKYDPGHVNKIMYIALIFYYQTINGKERTI